MNPIFELIKTFYEQHPVMLLLCAIIGYPEIEIMALLAIIAYSFMKL